MGSRELSSAVLAINKSNRRPDQRELVMQTLNRTRRHLCERTNIRSRARCGVLLFSLHLFVGAVHNPAAGSCQVSDSPDTSRQQKVLVRVEDAEGNRVAGATIELTYLLTSDEPPQKLYREPHRTDEHGQLVLDVPADAFSPSIFARKAGLVTQYQNWRTHSGESVPDEVTFTLIPGVKIGGTIVDRRGDPIADVAVELLMQSKDVAFTNPPPSINITAITGDAAPRTDRQGKWSFDGVPEDAKIRLKLHHPDYISDAAFVQKRPGLHPSDYRDFTARTVMDDGIRPSGRVADIDGVPIAKAVVRLQQEKTEPPTGLYSAVTDERGEFKLPAILPGKYRCAVVAPAYAFKIESLEIKPQPSAIELVLDKGEPLTIRVVDQQDQPVAAHCAVQWQENSTLMSQQSLEGRPDIKLPTQTDAQGIFRWPNAPAGKYRFAIVADGYDFAAVEAVAGGDEVTVQLQRLSKFTARVVDGGTGEPIKRFAVYHWPKNTPRQPISTATFREGEFDVEARYLFGNSRLVIEALGYRTFVSEDDLSVLKQNPEITFRLEPADEVTGIVVDAAGKPVAGALISVRPTSVLAAVRGQDLPEFFRVLTDRSGAFRFPAQAKSYSLGVRAKQGFAKKSFAANQAELGEIVLQPNGKIQGIVQSDGIPLAEIHVRLAAGLVYDETETDEDGRFEFRDVTPGEVRLTFRQLDPTPANSTATGESPESITKSFELPAGETATVTVDF